MTGSVLVVGGGIAGRAVARVLAKHGVDCTLVERRASGGRGMGVNLPGNAVRALGALGVPAEMLAGGVPVLRREYRNGRGRLLFAMDDERFWRGVGQPVCLRHGDLLEALAPPSAVSVRQARAVSARPTASGVEVDVEAVPRPLLFDLVIGADGVRSAMRAAIAPDRLRSQSMSSSSWRFITDNPGVHCWTAWSARDVTFLLIPVAPGQVYGYAARTRGGHTEPDPSWLTQAAAPFPDVVGAAVASTGAELFHSDVDEVRLEHWHRGRLVLVGDAAHATGPVWAQGVAMALEDALVLGELLSLTPQRDWADVGAVFERIRRPRVEHVRAATDRMSGLAALPGVVRDAVAPVLGPRAYRKAYGPLRAALKP
ncbi:FAD-dependent monooxygenase [Occultella aeris]|uniref:3-hydroxybenzoate 6-hydroxylase 1 n=1 Tax=Occultella aeris TaxID=2761496 RepID=A0A7M4DFY2_9MICO|nr:NAD(P)/FAD-dependent oxidoreductase [Occultella aeris]VZO35825.1 3-hydroxybenzoate 6-hydroxylase 1 [Occultella aeris]